VTYVHYKGTGPVMPDLMAGRVDITSVALLAVLPLLKAGKLRALATSGDKRTVQLPQVPSFAEAGIQDFNPQSWSGLFVPAGTPQAIVQRLHDEFSQTLKDPEVLKRLQDLSAEPVMSSPDQFAAFLKTESERLGRLIRERGISAN